jgi:hypothetical protein
MPTADTGSRPQWESPISGDSEIIREVYNLGRRMFLVRFNDGETTFLFPNEVATTGTNPREHSCR